MRSLDELLRASAALHPHLCPRQVLGVRMGLLAGGLLGLDLPQRDKRLFVIVETDGCAADGVAVATGCWVGRRTLYVVDFGKVAATFVDTRSGRAIRVCPRAAVRSAAAAYAPEADTRWRAQLLGYQRMPVAELLLAQDVTLEISVERLVGRAGSREVCRHCGEEIINQREVTRGGLTLCRACAGNRYYRLARSLADAALSDGASSPTVAQLLFPG